MKAFLNVLGIIASVLFSVVLVAVLITAPIWQGVSGLLKPAALADLVGQIDLTEIAAADPDLLAELADSGLSQEDLEMILHSNTFDEVVSVLAKDALQAAQGQFTTTGLNAETLQGIVDRNRAEIVTLVKQLVPEAQIFTDAQLEQLVDNLLPSLTPSLVSELDAAMLEMQTELVQQGVSQMLHIAAGPTVMLVLVGVALVLAGLIFLCRRCRAESLIWLAVDSILASLPVLGLGVMLKGSGVLSLLAAELPEATVAAPVIRAIGTSVLIGGAVLLVLGIVLIAAFIMLRDRRMKKAQRPAIQPPLGEVL